MASQRLFRKRHAPVGARPGTLAISPESPRPRITAMHYTPKGCTEEKYEPGDDLSPLRHAFDENDVTWIDVQGYGDKPTIKQLGELFQLHPLLLEDVVNVPQRPKAESYGDQVLIVVRMVRIVDDDESVVRPYRDQPQQHVEMEQVSLVVAAGHVLTFQERYGDILDPVRKRVRKGTGIIRKKGPDYLAYAIADTIIDGYYPVLEIVGDRLETLEDEVIMRPGPRVLAELNGLKNQLINLRRAIWPQRDAVNSLVRGDYDQFTDETCVYLRDTYDHCIQSSEVAEMYREMVTGLMNTYLSSVANRTNDVMKVLTIVSSLFVPLTFMAGIYGMNFEYIPELKYRAGYFVLWGVMLATAAAMIVYFYRLGWFRRES